MILRLLSALKIMGYDPRAVFLSSKASNPFTPLGFCDASSSSVIIFRVQSLDSLGFACPRIRSTSERD